MLCRALGKGMSSTFNVKTVCKRHPQLQGFLLSCTQLASLVGFLSKLEGIPNYYFPELKIFWGFAVAGRLPIWKDPGPVSGPKPRILRMWTLAMHNG